MNALTSTVFQDLHDSWYSVQMLTCDPEKYRTYQSKVPGLKLLDKVEPAVLEAAGAFDADIFVAGHHDDQLNFELGLAAKKAGVKRVIVRQRQPNAEVMARLAEAGIESFSVNNLRGALLAALIESPAVYHIITDVNNALYDVVVKNSAYTGRQLMDWDFIDQITVSRIKRGNKWISPHGSTVVEPGDELIYSGPWREADKIHEILSRN